MEELDIAFQNIETIATDVLSNLENIETEEESKIQIINRVLHECLGWPHSSFKAETKHENGYSDYIMYEKNAPVLLLEAKRIGKTEISTTEKNKVRYLKISGPGLKGANEGIDQAVSYATPNGIDIAVLTDGISWIIFKTFIPGEQFKEKQAIVFPSLESIIEDFSIFYDLLARAQINKRVYKSIFDKIHHNRLLLTQNLVSPIKESDIIRSQKSGLAFDLENVFNQFFSSLTRNDDKDLLIECFVESRESRIADFSLEKMTQSVLGNINPINKSVDNELASLIETNVEIKKSATDTVQTVFIVGPSGAGKTTFLDRFFRKTLSRQVKSQCVLIPINCLDSTGNEGAAISWVAEQLIDSIEKDIYKNGYPNRQQLRGLYNGEYLQQKNVTNSHLFKRDPTAFEEKFDEFLSNKVDNDREGYLKRTLDDIVKNRGKLPIFIFDNTDGFSLEFKERLFQFIQALGRYVHHCLIIFPVTDKSAWVFSKTEIFKIYKSRSFFLPTPSPREVLRKRIEYLKQKILPSLLIDKKKEYISSRGIKISIEDLRGFANVLENIFVESDFTSKTIGALTNYNIGRTLLLSQRVITSSVMKIEDLIKSFVTGNPVGTNFTKFMDALLKGDYELFKKGDNHEIYPVFQVDSEIRQSPLINLRILVLLNGLQIRGKSIEEKHLDVQSIIDYFDSIGCTESSINTALSSLLGAELIEPYDVSNRKLSSDQKLAISSRGRVHLNLAQNNSVFFYQMALTTYITDCDVASMIKDVYRSRDSFHQKLREIKALFSDYLVSEDTKFVLINSELEQYDTQKDLTKNIIAFGKNSEDPLCELAATFGDTYKQGLIKNEVIATVDWFDVTKGFGFAEVEEIDAKVYFNSSNLHEFGIQSVSDGDEILCDLARNEKGIFICKIHEIDVNTGKITPIDCTIVRLFSERNYGFAGMKGSQKNAFFHISIFDEDHRPKLFEGMVFKGEIVPVKKGDGYQVRRIVDIN